MERTARAGGSAVEATLWIVVLLKLDYAQGFLLARPMSPEALLELLGATPASLAVG